MIKLVIFDLDGTLVNSLCDLADSVEFALSKFGFPSHNLDEYKRFVGNGIRMLIYRAVPENFRDDKTVDAVLDEFKAYYNLHYVNKTRPYDGISELLSALDKNGVKTAVASNKADEFTKKIVSSLFSNFKFSKVLGNMDGIKKKPDPEIVFKILEELCVNSEDCLFVGDTNVDIMTGKNAKVKTVGCLWGFRDESELKDAGADYIVENPKEILDIVTK